MRAEKREGEGPRGALETGLGDLCTKAGGRAQAQGTGPALALPLRKGLQVSPVQEGLDLFSCRLPRPGPYR